MHPIVLWLFFSLFMMPIDEYWNGVNPRPGPLETYIFINWEKNDFIIIEEGKKTKYILKKYKETDNIYKAEARRYWYEHKAK